ncbi:MAG: GYD domain-containing protein [Nitrospirae bacterium]|nr:GYD domain-containing protein [Nitrospirota bacterium]
MPIYVLLSTLTDQGRKTIKAKPSRIKQVNIEIESMGAKVLSQYALLGPYDFVNIIEAKDNKAIAKISMELGSRGSVQFLTMPAIPIEEFIASIKK